MNEKVYVVVWSYYDDWAILGVFATEELAKDYVNQAIRDDHYTVLNQYKIIPKDLIRG